MVAKPIWVALAMLMPSTVDDCPPKPISPAVATALSHAAQQLGAPCPRSVNPQEFCNLVSDQIPSSTPGPDRFVYQAKIRQAACILPTDDADLVRGKVQAFWDAQHATLKCSQLGFSIREGYILKLAVERNSKDFINDALRKWQVDLNHVDRADGRTTLDYIEDELAKARGTGLEPILQRYESLFRKFGAKRKSELP